jgi:hypothetical protein
LHPEAKTMSIIDVTTPAVRVMGYRPPLAGSD